MERNITLHPSTNEDLKQPLGQYLVPTEDGMDLCNKHFLWNAYQYLNIAAMQKIILAKKVVNPHIVVYWKYLLN
jgi:hypothetical protein